MDDDLMDRFTSSFARSCKSCMSMSSTNLFSLLSTYIHHSQSISNSDVCTKYQEASKIVNLALTGLISQCIPGAKILDLCNFGTTIINTQAGKLYQKKVKGVAVERGVAFPVCVSVNDVICNLSPLGSEELVSRLSLVKI